MERNTLGESRTCRKGKEEDYCPFLDFRSRQRTFCPNRVFPTRVAIVGFVSRQIGLGQGTLGLQPRIRGHYRISWLTVETVLRQRRPRLR